MIESSAEYPTVIKVCKNCKTKLPGNALIKVVKGTIEGLSCCNLGNLLFVPSGDPCITRRSNKYSSEQAIVYKWNSLRKRNERKGVLVAAKAFHKAKRECIKDKKSRSDISKKLAIKREVLDQKFIHQFAKKVRCLFPSCPNDREFIISAHACLKYSQRVGRSAFAKDFDRKAISLSVRAHIRHEETNYDSHLYGGLTKKEARLKVQGNVEKIFKSWKLKGK